MKLKGFNNAELGKICDIGRGVVGNYVKGGTPNLGNAVEIANALGSTVDAMVQNSEELKELYEKVKMEEERKAKDIQSIVESLDEMTERVKQLESKILSPNKP